MPTHPTADLLDAKWQRLLDDLRAIQRPAVLFSGGVDSTLLLVACRRVHGPNTLAATILSPLMTKMEREDVLSLASELDVRHRIIDMDECSAEAFCANPPDRCAICKRMRLEAVFGVISDPWVFLDGENADDAAADRPGRAVSDAFGVRHPLLEAGLAKADIRRLAKREGLRVWDRPANACLATRIPHGRQIDHEKLQQIEICESRFRERTGIRLVRVRHEGFIARIEIPVEEMNRLNADAIRDITGCFRKAGFHSVLLDLEGYRSGGAREPLTCFTSQPLIPEP